MPKPDQTDAAAAAESAESAPQESPESAPADSGVAETESRAANESPPADVAEAVAEPADDAAAAPAADELRARLEAAQAENAQMKDGLLRAKAEVENIRRRSQEEIVKARKFAIEGFAKELLEVKDNLDRAAAVALDEGAGDAVRQMNEGLGLTLKQLDLTLARFAVVEVEAAPGVKFDPARHHAVSKTPNADIAADHIVEVVQKGFALKERLLRPAMVVVAGDAAA